MTSAYPIPAAELVERVRALAVELGEWPSQRRVMRECRVGAPRADAALAALRDEGFEPTPSPVLTVVPDAPETQPEAVQEHTEQHQDTAPEGAPDDTVEAATEGPQIDGEPLATGAAGAAHPASGRRVPRWPLLIIAAGAFVSIWSGWVGLGKLTGFGPVVLLPGIADAWTINSAITLPLGVEAYAAFAMWVWLSDAPTRARARTFARWSALGALALGAAGQIAYHLMVAAGLERAPWQITAFVSCLPVVVLGCGAALVHLIHRQEVPQWRSCAVSCGRSSSSCDGCSPPSSTSAPAAGPPAAGRSGGRAPRSVAARRVTSPSRTPRTGETTSRSGTPNGPKQATDQH